jgi:hypothetical protein
MECRRRVQRLTAASSGVAAPRPRHARKIAASTGGDPALAEVAARVSDKLADSLRGVQDVLLEHGAARHFRDVDTPVTVAFSVGSVMSLVLLDGWLFPPNQRRPGKARETPARYAWLNASATVATAPPATAATNVSGSGLIPAVGRALHAIAVGSALLRDATGLDQGLGGTEVR